MSNTKEKIDEIAEAFPENGISIAIESTEQMFKLFQEWQQHLIGILNHMLTIPEGTVIADSGGVEHTLSNDYLDGFKSGIEVALIELSNFPIKATLVDESA